MNERRAAGSISPGFAVSAGCFIAIVLACALFLMPEVERLERAIANTGDASFVIKRKLRDLEQQAERIAADRADFATLTDTGIFEPQNRLQAARLLEELRMRHGLSGLEYQILPVKRVTLERSGESGIEIVMSDLTLDMRGFLERDILDFLQAIVGELSGDVTINSLEFTRSGEPEAAVLREVRNGTATELVQGQASLSWRTLTLRETPS